MVKLGQLSVTQADLDNLFFAYCHYNNVDVCPKSNVLILPRLVPVLRILPTIPWVVPPTMISIKPGGWWTTRWTSTEFREDRQRIRNRVLCVVS